MNAPLRPEDLLQIPEVMRLLHVSRSLAYKLCTDGTIPSARIASVGSRRGRLVVRRRDVEAYLNRQFAERPAAPRPVDVDVVVARVRKRHG